MAAIRNRKKGSGLDGGASQFDAFEPSFNSFSSTNVEPPPTRSFSSSGRYAPPPSYSDGVSGNKRVRIQELSTEHPEMARSEYPETFGTFADGLKGDIFELFETGAKVLNKSFKLLLPFGDGQPSNGPDAMRDLEIRRPLSNITNEQSGSAADAFRKSAQAPPSASKMSASIMQAEEAIRMRCASMWTDKKSSGVKTDGSVFLPMPKPQNLFPAFGAKEQAKVKEGVKVQLGKLDGNNSIQSFECCNNTILLVGNKRLILAEKNFDEGNTGTVLWSQSMPEIDSCTISFNSK
jgi:hypothetical protein